MRNYIINSSVFSFFYDCHPRWIKCLNYDLMSYVKSQMLNRKHANTWTLKELLNKAFKFTEKHLNAKVDILLTVFNYNKNI